MTTMTSIDPPIRTVIAFSFGIGALPPRPDSPVDLESDQSAKRLMGQIFNALPGILVRALPTFVIVILLHWYLKKVLFQPLEKVLDERRRKTQGAVEASEASLAQVHSKLEDYEKSLNAARAEIYAHQETRRQALSDQQSKAVEAARAKAAERIAAAKAAIAAEAAAAQSSLAAEADRLASQMANLVLAGRAQ